VPVYVLIALPTCLIRTRVMVTSICYDKFIDNGLINNCFYKKIIDIKMQNIVLGVSVEFRVSAHKIGSK
jgi:hypothetical protein